MNGAKMRNIGEACTAANRFIVHESVADEFAQKFAAKISELKVGNGMDEGSGQALSAQAVVVGQGRGKDRYR